MDARSRRLAEQRLSTLDALVSAQEQRAKVMSVIETAEDVAEATSRLTTLLGVEVPEARAVLDLQMQRWTKQERLRILEERDNVKSVLSNPSGTD
jgi:DNA gyrase/topoisomerase IV subunit A